MNTEKYNVKKSTSTEMINVEVPGSKSMTNRALLLAALSKKRCLLKGVLFSDDSRAFLDCLQKLGFELSIDEAKKQVTICGTGGLIPNKEASINVRSAGTAARFMTVFLAFAGGRYECDASAQMCKRPMQEIIDVLRKLDVKITCTENEGHFPFIIENALLGSEGRKEIKRVTIDTAISSQYASALLMASALLPGTNEIILTGDRTNGSYINMTIRMMEQFGINIHREGDACTIEGGFEGLEVYEIEPDISAASYFYAAGMMLKRDALVRGVHRPSLQGDMRFVELLEKLGGRLEETKEGLVLRASNIKEYPGIDISLKDFSDQTMTLAVVAVFATSKTRISNIGHIRFQESDRISAIVTELNKLGIECTEDKSIDGIVIKPGTPVPCAIDTYEDHRMAMAFSLIGLKLDGIVINNPMCCRKTFENFFEVLEEID